MKNKRIFFIYFFILGFGFFLMALSLLLFPKSIKFFIRENMLLENLTTIFYLISFLFAACLMILYKKQLPLLGSICLLSLICGLDEISYGRYIFDTDAIKILGVRLDSVHDLIELIGAWLKNFDFIDFIVVILILTGLIIFFKIKKGIFLKKIINFLKKIFLGKYKFYFLIFIFCFLLSSFIDLDLFKRSPESKWFAIEEYLEMSASFLLVFFNINLLVEMEKGILDKKLK
jgi:hypothetical protein